MNDTTEMLVHQHREHWYEQLQRGDLGIMLMVPHRGIGVRTVLPPGFRRGVAGGGVADTTRNGAMRALYELFNGLEPPDDPETRERFLMAYGGAAWTVFLSLPDFEEHRKRYVADMRKYRRVLLEMLLVGRSDGVYIQAATFNPVPEIVH